MNIYRQILKIWITVTSVIGFVAGWVFLSRAAELEEITTIGNTAINMPEMPSLPTLDGSVTDTSNPGNVQSFTVNTAPQTNFTQPMRTGGS
ncbi:MAG TPA: hypothetical protein PK078_13515 [Anaerolineales bacterium]|nr:hypothetical protein [Anaerolineales bacterium]HNA90316.1 hypothetical protein [Anaerolineales bacterium]HNB37428.1 hypothetical protein [Anaerolineales bacterium]HNC07990.1 hypothetical protein [Anaerolineales bacterium]